MKNLAIKFIGAATLAGVTTCSSVPSQGGIITSAEENEVSRVRLLLDAKHETAKLEQVGMKILADTIAVTVLGTGQNTRNLTSKICAIYNAERSIEGPKELRDAYSRALNKELYLGGETKDNVDLRNLIMEGTVNVIERNVQEVRKACLFKFGI